jgi:hypothetical protein
VGEIVVSGRFFWAALEVEEDQAMEPRRWGRKSVLEAVEEVLGLPRRQPPQTAGQAGAVFLLFWSAERDQVALRALQTVWRVVLLQQITRLLAEALAAEHL